MPPYKTIRVDIHHPVAVINGAVKGPRAVKATVYEHKYVLYEKIGPGPHPCHWCGVPLNWIPGTREGALLADHLNEDKRDNRPENLVPACNGCNTIRSRREFRPAIEVGELFVVAKDGTKTRAGRVTCDVCQTEFLASVTRINNGTVTVCSRVCAGIKGRRTRWGAAW